MTGRESRLPARDPLWWRIFWPLGKALFLGLAAIAIVLDVLLIVQAAA